MEAIQITAKSVSNLEGNNIVIDLNLDNVIYIRKIVTDSETEGEVTGIIYLINSIVVFVDSENLQIIENKILS